MTDPTQTAEQLKPLRQDRRASRCWRAGWAAPDVAAGEAILNHAGIPTFPYPDTAARAFNYMWRYSVQPARPVRDARAARRSDGGDARPRRGRGDRRSAPGAGPDAADRVRVEAAAGRLRHPDRRRRASPPTEDEAVAAAEQIGYPVVLKLHSETITHKTDVGGVQLNLRRRRRRPRRRSGAIETVGRRAGRRRALPGRDRAADGQARTATS